MLWVQLSVNSFTYPVRKDALYSHCRGLGDVVVQVVIRSSMRQVPVSAWYLTACQEEAKIECSKIK